MIIHIFLLPWAMRLMIASNVIMALTIQVPRQRVFHVIREIIMQQQTPTIWPRISPWNVWSAILPCQDGSLHSLIILSFRSPLVMPLLTAINVMIRQTIPTSRLSVSPAMRPITTPPLIPTTSQPVLTTFAWNVTPLCQDGSLPSLNIQASR